MAYSIPQTNKPLPYDGKSRPILFKYEYAHTLDSNHTETITNPNDYAIECVISLNAGSGDTNPSTYRQDSYYNKNNYNAYLYTYAGRTGNNISLLLDDELILALAGGVGTPSMLIATGNGYTYKDSGDKHSSFSGWYYNANKGLTLAQNGDSIMIMLTLPPKGELKVEFTYNSASAAAFKGSMCISGIA